MSTDLTNDPNVFHGLPSEWRDKVMLAVRTVSPLFHLYGWTYYDGTPDESRLRNGLAHCVRTTLDGALGCSTGRWRVCRHQGEEGMDDEISIALDLGAMEVEPIDWPEIAPRAVIAALDELSRMVTDWRASHLSSALPTGGARE